MLIFTDSVANKTRALVIYALPSSSFLFGEFYYEKLSFLDIKVCLWTILQVSQPHLCLYLFEHAGEI